MELLKRRYSAIAIGAACIALVLLISSPWLFSTEQGPSGGGTFSPTVRVSDGSFDIHVVAPAVLDARQSITLSSELPSNKAKLLFLATEGDLIRAGEIVARFDPTPFEEDLQNLESDIKELQASLQQARADLALNQQESLDQNSRLEYQIEVARIKLNNLENVDIPARESQASRDLSKARAEHERAARELQTQRELVNKGLTRKSELQEAGDLEAEQRANYQIARKAMEALRQISFPSELKQARLELDHSERERDSYTEIHRQRMAKQQAGIARTENKIATQQRRVEKTHAYMEMTTLTAPVTGIILYKKVSQGTEKRKPQVGDSLWNRQAFAVIPDLSSLVAYANITEQDIGKIAVGQPTRIQPEAYGGLTLVGTVDSIGTLADDSQSRGSKRYFRIRIALDDIDPRLRPGMSARASILAASYDDAVRIPVEAVFYEDLKPVAFLWRNGRGRRVELALGDSDGDFIVVNQGVQAGQELMLVYPEELEH